MRIANVVIIILLLGSSFFSVVLADEIAIPRVLPSIAVEPIQPTINAEEIAKKLANPIANMMSVPLQYQFSRGVGKNQGGSEQTLLFQPVIPFNLGGGDTFLVRPIVTGVRETSIQGPNGQFASGYGIAGVTVESFYAPNTNSSWIWGIGPYAQSPSGNSGHYGSQQTGAGITAAVLNRDGPWTYGLLGYQSWNVGGNPTFGTQNNIFGEPFIAYTTNSAFTFVSNMQALYNYDSRRTSNPLYVGVSKVEVIDGVPIAFAAGPIYYLSNTPGGPSGWGGRATVTLVIAE